MVEIEWQKIRADYISGNTSYRKLAEKYGISFNTLKDRAVAEQWYKLRQQNHNKTTTEIIDAVNNQNVQTAVDIASVADKLLLKIGKIAEMYDDPDSIKKLTSAIKDLKDIKGYKSAIDLEEQTARINKLRKEAEDDSTDKEIKVIIEGDLERYSK